jgi:hypothetical protein
LKNFLNSSKEIGKAGVDSQKQNDTGTLLPLPKFTNPTFSEEKHKLPTICQLNVELHFPPENYGYQMDTVLDGLNTFFSNGTYTVFNIEIFLRLVRMFVVNTESPECVEKFFC